MSHQIPLTPVTGANIPVQPLTPITGEIVVHSSTGQLNGRNVTVSSNPGTHQQSEGWSIEVLDTDVFVKIHILLLSQDNIAFGLTSKRHLEILNCNRLPLISGKVQMACDRLLKGYGYFKIDDAHFMMASIKIIENGIQKCSSFIQCYKEIQFQLADLITDLTTPDDLVLISMKELLRRVLRDFPRLADLAMQLIDLKKWIKELKNSQIGNPSLRNSILDKMKKSLKPQEIKTISHWLIFAIIELHETEGLTLKERKTVQIALEESLGWLFRHCYQNKFDDLLLFFGEMIKTLGEKLLTKDYDGVFRRLIFKAGQCTMLDLDKLSSYMRENRKDLALNHIREALAMIERSG